MKYSCVGVPSGSKASTYHENKDSVNHSSLPDRTWMTKPQLNRLIDLIDAEKTKLINEALRLKRQRTEDLLRINEQQEKIIELYARINCDTSFSPLMKAG